MNLEFERERKRIERGNYHYQKMLERYYIECGECTTRMATPEEIKKYNIKVKDCNNAKDD